MTKIAVILTSLVDESAQKPNEEIEKEILESLSKGMPRMPWLKNVKKVSVAEV